MFALGAAEDAPAPLTLRAAAAKVQDAISFGEIASQNAAANHPIWQALADAREAKGWIEDQIPWYSSDGLALPNVSAKVDEIVAEVYDAAATIRTDPTLPLPKTKWELPSLPPWGWIALGGASLFGVAYYFLRRRAAP